MLKFLSVLTGIFISVLVLSAILFHEPFNKKETLIVNPNYEPLPELLTPTPTQSLEVHFKNLQAHLKKPYFQNTKNGLLYRDDNAFEKYYTTFTQSQEVHRADIGNMILSMFYLRNNRVNFGYEHFRKLSTKDLPFYQQEKGLYHFKYRELDSAEICLAEAVQSYPESNDAQEGLITTYYYSKNYSALVDHLTPQTLRYYPENILSDTYFYDNRVIDYYAIKLKHYSSTWIEAFAALLVAGLWLIYLFRLNIFKTINLSPLILTSLFASFMTFFCLWMYDFYHVYFDFDINGEVPNDFAFTIAGIGLIEELAKFVPVIFVLSLFRKRIDDPYHYVLVASVSALTFSTLENIIYFKLYAGQVIYIRSMVSVIVHLFGTCLITYGFFVVSYAQHKINWGFGALCFLCAILVHGLFDLVLINNNLHLFHLFSYLLMFFAAYALNRIINYALNTSPSFDLKNKVDDAWLKKFMIYGFTGILLLEFLIGSIWNGFYEAKDILIDSMLPFLLLLGFLVSNLSSFHLIEGFRTGIFQLVHGFRHLNLLHANLKLQPVVRKEVSSGFTVHTSVLRVVDNAANYIKATVTGSDDFQGHTLLLIQPFQEKEMNGMKQTLYVCNVYGVKDHTQNQRATWTKKEIQLLTKAHIYLDNLNAGKKSWVEKLGAAPVIGAVVAGSLLFMVYMNYKSARLAYRWTFDFLEIKDLYQASQNLRYALDKDNSFSEAHLLMGKIDVCLNQYEDALKDLEHVTPHTASEKETLLFLKGYSLYKSGITTSAYRELTELVNRFPHSMALDSAYFMLANTDMKNQAFDQAYHKLSQIKKQNQAVQYLLGCSLFEQKKYKESDVEFSRLLKNSIRPSPDLLYRKGVCLLHLQDSSAACQYLQQAAEQEHIQATALKDDLCYSYLHKE